MSQPNILLVGLIPIYVGCKREDYPLLSAKVHYDVSDVQMHASLIQTYTSKAALDADIRYVFPLPPDASVCAFKAVIDDERTIKGTLKEKATAKAEYDQAVAQGKTAALLEQGNVEIFQVSLGNIKPGQKIEVHISFVSVISHDGNLDSLRLTFPSTIAPRYGTAPRGMFGSFGLQQSADPLDFSVAVEMTSHIKSITSPSHPIAMKLGESTLEPSDEFDPKKARVSLSSPALLEKDIVLVLSCQGLDRPRCMVESLSPEEGGKEYTDAYALTLVPRFELPPLAAQEYIFLVDRSGSMNGGKMTAVRSALQILLKSLPSRGTSFNIISFGSRHSSLWRSSVTYSAESVKTASAHVDKMTADHGGTEIREAIQAAFSSRVAARDKDITATSVFVLTDGQAYDLEGVQTTIRDTVAQAKEHNMLLRVFCMGIGNAVSKAMCDVIARTGKGTAVFVGETEKPDQKLVGLLRAARGAVVEDISIDWGVVEDDSSENDGNDFEMVSQDDSPEPAKEATPMSLFDESSTTLVEKVDIGPQAVKLLPPPRVQQAPTSSSLPPLYPGFRTSLFAIIRRSKGGNTPPAKSVRVKGTVQGRPVALEVPVSQPSKPTAGTPTQAKMLHSLAARALIQSIEDKAAMYMSETDKAEVLRLALRYGLASSQTSFVAVDELSVIDRAPNVARLHEDGSWTQVRPTGNLLYKTFGGNGGGGGMSSTSLFSTRSRRQSSDRSSTGTSSLFQAPGGAPQPAPASSSLFGAARTSLSSTPLFGAAPKSSALTAHSLLRSGGAEPPEPFLGFGSSSPPPPAPPPPPQGNATPSHAFGFGILSSIRGQSAPAPAPQQQQQQQWNASASQDLLGGFDSPPSPAAKKISAGADYAKEASKPEGAPGGRTPGRGAFGGVLLQSESVQTKRKEQSSIETFARAQLFDGSFPGSPALYKLLVQQSKAPAKPATLEGTDETVWCTLLCVAYLEVKFADDKDVWMLLVEKALQFVEDTLKGTLGGVDVEELIPKLLQDAKKCIV